MIFRKLPVVPQEGQGAVFNDIFLESFIRLNLYKSTDTPTLKSIPYITPIWSLTSKLLFDWFGAC